jgi:methionine-S-sulfoxide reductase
VLAGGCFWGVEAVLQQIEGMETVVSGYSGGDAGSAHYDIVDTGKTGHTEAVQVTYDPRKISYGRLLKVFFSVAHDPTQLNRQALDVGPQYRSAIFLLGSGAEKNRRGICEAVGASEDLPCTDRDPGCETEGILSCRGAPPELLQPESKEFVGSEGGAADGGQDKGGASGIIEEMSQAKGNSEMRITTLRTSCIAVILIVPIVFTMKRANGSGQITNGDQPSRSGHSSGLMAKITLPDGTSRTARLEGVGCPVSMCSRVAIKGIAKGDSLVRAWLDTIAAIKDTTADDALFVKKDGTEQRLSLVNDFRVLYLANRNGGTDKLELTKVKSLEFLAPAK